jgi:hypothetical protein
MGMVVTRFDVYLVQEGGNFQTILKAKKSDFFKKSDFSMG